MPDLDLLDRLAPDVDTDAGLAELGRRRRRARRQRRVLPALVATIALVVLAGGVLLATRPTGTDDSTDPATELDSADLVITWRTPEASPVSGDPRLAGKELMLTSWTTADGVEHPVPESMPLERVLLGFRDEELYATTGCNDLTGSWTLDGDVLEVPILSPRSTFSCGAELSALEQQIVGVLLQRPTLVVDDRRSIELVDPGGRSLTYEVTGLIEAVEDTIETTVPLDGASWQVDTWGDGAGTARPEGSLPTLLDLDDDGTFAVRTECTIGRGSFTIDGDVIRASNDITGDCDRAPLPHEAAVLSILEEGATIRRSRATLLLQTSTGLMQLAARVYEHPIMDRFWRVERWTDDGVDHGVAELDGLARGVPGIRLLPNGHITVGAGCNSMGALYALDGNELVVSGVGGTNMACTDAVMDLERLLTDLFADGTEVHLDGDQLVMRSGDRSVTFTDEG
jgi:heat shock protein HslJ